MNAPIRKLALVVTAMFCALFVASTWIVYVQADELRDKPGNRRTLLASYSQERGAILVAGEAIARSEETSDELKYQRTYPKGKLNSHLTGYFSFIYGAGGGLESAENGLLAGDADQLFYRRLGDLLTGRQPSGVSLELTIDPRAQEAAQNALGNQKGSVVALDPKTGAILALISHPQYDPNTLSSHNLDSVQQAWAALNEDSERPLVNRAIGGDLYPPGSVFKIITAAAALSSGRFDTNSQLPGPAVLDLPQTTAGLVNDWRGQCGDGTVNLLQAMEDSCNTAFGWLGMQLGGQALRDEAAKFGFGQQIGIPMSVTPSTMPEQMNAPQEAQSAIGQYDVRVTPLQVAMMSAAVANQGTLMQPFLVKQTRGSDLEVIDQTAPRELSKATTPEVAGQLTQMMEAVVTSGTGTRARISGVRVAGKTGTAQHGEGLAPHAWFTGFAPADDPAIAVAVVVEDGGDAGMSAGGGSVAAPIARQVMEAVISR
ncbi:peptidoglycan glycosyltransferase [Kineosphaera limosa]|uniref:Penicillin-binding protein PbpA n=1 Tax=Kineosphaera limosa NBRC 100340 TaxID=1184609 RepID=K6WNK4_9MICO|nr:penicillin-binding transpeptidase domain-containing protein [Kineosphaera limosa]NYE00990.1 peptidoglycan glycosyltransferase [Kineosphaera limosa]GAB95376.1 penicillin-binding protein PbpA [Kineosphaera limosa NBRC 100340]